MVADSESGCAGIDLLSSEESSCSWRRGIDAAPYAQERCIHQLFEDQVEKSQGRRRWCTRIQSELWGAECGGQPSGASPDRAGSWRTLGWRSAWSGCGDGDRSAGDSEGGRSYVPLDPAYPSERLSQIVTDASPSLVLIDRAGREALGETALAGRTLVDLEPLREGRATVWSFEAVEDPQVGGLTSRQLAYVIYTSGSTGTPKGVMVEHHSLVNFHQAVQRDIYRRDARLRIG